MASTYLTRTQTTGNRTTFTWSGWVKKNDTSSSDKFLTSCGTASNFRTQFFFDGSDRLQFYNDDGGSNNMNILTTRVFRDVNAWYHIVLRFDTTQSTASDRIRFYVNGVQETVLTNTTYPAQNADNTQFNYNGVAVDIGRRFYNNTNHWDGSMSHVHFCDGQSYGPDSFGSTDATTGEWKINTSPSVTYGTNGFFILKDGNSVTDQSGNGNNFTVGGGTLTNTEDCPSNVFCTLNPLDRSLAGTAPTFAYGNTQWTSSGNSTGNNGTRMTLGTSSGKYYFEAKVIEASQTNLGYQLDSVAEKWDASGYIGTRSGFYGLYIDSNDALTARVAGSGVGSTLATLSNNDILGLAYDFDNNKFYVARNGTWLNSGDPTSGATGTGSLGNLLSGTYLPIIGNVNYTIASSTAFNFGNGYFGTTAVASAGTNASGNGIFEYDVPTGFTALSTKGLNL